MSKKEVIHRVNHEEVKALVPKVPVVIRLVHLYAPRRDLSKRMKLTFGQIKVVNAFRDHPTRRVSEIAHALRVTNGSASIMVERMVRLGLVKRADDLHDRRASVLTLTPRGRALRDQHLKFLERSLANLLKHLSEEDQRRFVNALETLWVLLREHEDKPDRMEGVV